MHALRRRRKLRILITAGGTREYIDPVRFISNASSGKIGYELARAAVSAGHKVTLITGPSGLKAPTDVRVVEVETTAEMFTAVRKHFGKCDCLVMAAAVADYTPVRRARTKLKKSSDSITLKLRPTPDILKWAGGHKRPNQFVVGFALEDKNLCKNAEGKLREKNLDMIVANKPTAIGSDSCEVFVKKLGSNWRRIAKASKGKVASGLMQMIGQSIEED